MAELLSNQIAQLCAMTGKDPRELWTEVGAQMGIGGDVDGGVVVPCDDECVKPVKRKYNRVKPTTKPSEHELGHIELDADGRPHQVVMRTAFGGRSFKAWKMMTDAQILSRGEDGSKESYSMPTMPIKPTIKSGDKTVPSKPKRVSFVGPLVDYNSSDDEDEDNLPERPMMDLSPSDIDEHPASPPASPEMKPKRKYVSRKPATAPKTLEPGTKMEASGVTWVVATVKTRGDGVRHMWKIAPSGRDEVFLPEGFAGAGTFQKVTLPEGFASAIQKPVERCQTNEDDPTQVCQIIGLRPKKDIWAEAAAFDGWTCQTCMVQNAHSQWRCAACENFAPKVEDFIQHMCSAK